MNKIQKPTRQWLKALRYTSWIDKKTSVTVLSTGSHLTSRLPFSLMIMQTSTLILASARGRRPELAELPQRSWQKPAWGKLLAIGKKSAVLTNIFDNPGIGLLRATMMMFIICLIDPFTDKHKPWAWFKYQAKVHHEPERWLANAPVTNLGKNYFDLSVAFALAVSIWVSVIEYPLEDIKHFLHSL